MHLSLSQKRWVFDDFDPVKTRRLQIEYGLNPLLAQCLSTVLQHQDPQQWLFPSIEHLHDPYKMKNMSVAVERLEKALRDKERIRIVTDYDVDGTTSSLILQSVCRLLGGGELIDYHIPSRFTEGYGFSVVAAQKAIRDKIKLIVTADIGVRDHEAVRVAAEGGVDVIICDHHLPAGSSVPDAAVAVLCPPQEGCLYPNPALAACGVSLKLAQALLFRSAKWKDRPNVVWKIIRSMLKVVAIGTVADVVSLATIENRSIVALGLAELQDMRSHSVG
ncbi:MAG: DHH family phosphoesterase, partial [Myxococcota bacterium]|nr:DHH family phosphoesterase [Myxococcota bacterium]